MQIAQIPSSIGFHKQYAKRILIHSMAEYLELGDRDLHAADFLEQAGLSAHYLVTPSGVVIQTRQDTQGAYHARGFNEDSIGIEFLVPGVHTYATFLESIKKPYLHDQQYAAGVNLVSHLVNKYGIEDIKRHSDVDPGRKKDPGEGFPWIQFLREST